MCDLLVMADLLLSSPTGRVVRRRLRKDPVPRFKPDVSNQLDVAGACAAVVPEMHVARFLREEIEHLDLTAVVATYSSQGRHGYHPKHVLGALLLGSLMGVHHSTKLARRLVTDAAFRLVAGGHAISAGVLRRFRRENLVAFESANAQVLKLGHERGLVDSNALAVDSVRLRADASRSAVRTLERSESRLKELAAVDINNLSDAEKAQHAEKVAKHQKAVELCRESGRTSVVVTSPSAGLMKFPDGASGPGHRATVVATGKKVRLIVNVLVDADATDYGHLAPAVLAAREKLSAAGVKLEQPMQIAADAGYFSERDLRFAQENQGLADILIAPGPDRQKRSDATREFFTQEAFKREGNQFICPAGTAMRGPYSDGNGKERWRGVGCSTCGLREQCTSGKRRTLVFDEGFREVSDFMRQRMEKPGAKQRYNERIATVEPVFSFIESAMNFRRVTSRKEQAILAEIQLKVLAYNLSRLIAAKRSLCVRMLAAA